MGLPDRCPHAPATPHAIARPPRNVGGSRRRRTPGDGRRVEHHEARAIWSAVARLDPRAAVAVELHDRRGLSIDGVAAEPCGPANTVKTILHRVGAELRETLKPTGADD